MKPEEMRGYAERMARDLSELILQKPEQPVVMALDTRHPWGLLVADMLFDFEDGALDAMKKIGEAESPLVPVCFGFVGIGFDRLIDSKVGAPDPVIAWCSNKLAKAPGWQPMFVGMPTEETHALFDQVDTMKVGKATKPLILARS